MFSFIGSVGMGMFISLVAYGVLRFLLPELAASDQTNVIGMVAVLGAMVTGCVSRWLGWGEDGADGY